MARAVLPLPVAYDFTLSPPPHDHFVGHTVIELADLPPCAFVRGVEVGLTGPDNDRLAVHIEWSAPA